LRLIVQESFGQKTDPEEAPTSLCFNTPPRIGPRAIFPEEVLEATVFIVEDDSSNGEPHLQNRSFHKEIRPLATFHC